MTTNTATPIDIYEPHGAARDLLHCRDADVLISGPAGTGKSTAVMMKAFLIAEKYPGARILFTRKTRASMSETVLVDWEQSVVPPGHPCMKGAHRSHRTHYQFSNGSTIVVNGMDNADRIMSAYYDVVCLFEATELSEDDYEKITSRLRTGVVPYKQAISDCNPNAPTHWIKQRADAGGLTHLVSRLEDNPRFYDHKANDWTNEGREYRARLQSMTGLRYQRLYEGKWVGAEGQVFDEFDPQTHIIEPFDIPDGWRRFRSIDFGFTNPFACLWLAMDHDDRMFVYRQWYMSQWIVEDHADKIRTLSGDERIGLTVADHDAEDRATLRRHGIDTVPADKDVSTGIQAVQSRLRVQGDGKPRLFIFRDSLVEPDPKLQTARKSTCLEHEIPAYVWQQARDGHPEKEEPVKVNDHGCDALRYAVMRADKGTIPIGSGDDEAPSVIERPTAPGIYDGYDRSTTRALHSIYGW